MADADTFRSRSEKEIFFEALDKATPEERAAFLDGACGEDLVRRARVEGWLANHFQKDVFMKLPAADVSYTAPPVPSPAEQPAQMLGRYKLLEKIGEGGFGEVWMAEQREPVKRRVAVKILKLGMDTRQVVARFEAERQALALMDHPNIAKVLDGGATENGRPYFVMELVRGIKITEYCDRSQLSTQDRLQLFILVCQAIQHAHQKGVIHRDIKPSNILVTLHDGVPVPKVIDFGIAKATQQELTEKTLFTQFQQFMGTPAYISPEQAEMSGLDIDTRSDIYALGVLLYELLVGQTPFDAREMTRGGIEALRRHIREKEPAKPSTKLKTFPAAELTTTAQRRQTDPTKLSHLMRGDLDWIVMKCLEKDRARRYETANGLAMDIKRYLGNEPVVARPPTTAYRVQKLVRRNKLAFIASALIILTLAFGVSAVILVQHQANEGYRRRLYVSEIGRAGTAWQAGQSAQMLALLEPCPADLRSWEWDFLHRQADRWYKAVFLASTNLSWSTLSTDGQLAAVAVGPVLQIREFPKGQLLTSIPFAASWNAPFVISPAGDQVATLDGPRGIITIWNMRTGERVAEMNHGHSAWALTWSVDGQLLASGGDDGSINVWEAKGWRLQKTFGTTSPVRALAFSPLGQTLAVGTAGSHAQLLDSTTGALKRTFRVQGGHISQLKFSPDGNRLAISNETFGGHGRDNRVWNLDDEGSLDLSTGTDAVSFSFSSDGRQLYVADQAGMVRLWDLERRAEVERFSAHTGATRSIQVLADGRIFTSGSDGVACVWQARRADVVQLKGYPDTLRTLAFSPDSRWLVSSGIARGVIVWDPQGAHQAGVYTDHRVSASAVAFAPDGRVATASGDEMVNVWDPATLKTSWTQSIAPATDAYWLAYSPDGRRLYVASRTDTITVLDAASGQRLDELHGLENVLDGLAVSPDGRLLAVCQKVRLSLWFTDGLREFWHAPANPERCAAFSPDGKWLATGDRDGGVGLWEVASEGRVRRTLRGHGASVSGVSFNPNGSRLVSCGFDGLVKIWDWQAGAVLLTLPLPGGGAAWHAVFSPDGKTVAAAGSDGIITLWKTD